MNTAPPAFAGTRSMEEFEAILNAAVDGVILMDHQG
jgi:hypothetical protein